MRWSSTEDRPFTITETTGASILSLLRLFTETELIINMHQHKTIEQPLEEGEEEYEWVEESVEGPEGEEMQSKYEYDPNDKEAEYDEPKIYKEIIKDS